MEWIDVLDKDRKPTGKTVQRGEKLGAGEYRLVVHICIFNDKGQMLMQKRQSFKNGWPGMWDVTVGGGALAGENSRQAAHRELLEEIGVLYDFDDAAPALSVTFEEGFDDYYLIQTEIADCSKLTLQYDEVAEVRWADRDTIKKMIADGDFIPYYGSFIDLLFALQKKPGVLES